MYMYTSTYPFLSYKCVWNCSQAPCSQAAFSQTTCSQATCSQPGATAASCDPGAHRSATARCSLLRVKTLLAANMQFAIRVVDSTQFDD